MSEDAVYDLLRRVQPSEIEPRLYDVIHLCPDLTDTLLSTVDTPMKIEEDPEAGGQFVACEFNRDIDSHRSPLSNKYYPPLADGQWKSKQTMHSTHTGTFTSMEVYAQFTSGK